MYEPSIEYEKGYGDALEDAATAISNMCGYVDCPCSKNCNVYSDEECIDRIIGWFKSNKTI